MVGCKELVDEFSGIKMKVRVIKDYIYWKVYVSDDLRSQSQAVEPLVPYSVNLDGYLKDEAQAVEEIFSFAIFFAADQPEVYLLRFQVKYQNLVKYRKFCNAVSISIVPEP